MGIEQIKTIYKHVDHELCRKCTHDKDCKSVCIAIETLVQLAKVRSPMAQLEYVYNVGTQLDLENSFTASDL
jgi:hypothetical protein